MVEAADKLAPNRFKPLSNGTIIDDGDRRIVEVNFSNQPLGSSEFASKIMVGAARHNFQVMNLFDAAIVLDNAD